MDCEIIGDGQSSGLRWTGEVKIGRDAGWRGGWASFQGALRVECEGERDRQTDRDRQRDRKTERVTLKRKKRVNLKRKRELVE